RGVAGIARQQLVAHGTDRTEHPLDAAAVLGFEVFPDAVHQAERGAAAQYVHDVHGLRFRLLRSICFQSCIAAITESGVMGRRRTVTPSAFITALAMAATVGPTDGSPAPTAGASPSSTRLISTGGTCENRAMGYCSQPPTTIPRRVYAADSYSVHDTAWMAP